jgi:hypothetical protein
MVLKILVLTKYLQADAGQHPHRRLNRLFDSLTSHLSVIYLVVNGGYIINKQDTSQEKLGHPF